MNKPTLRRILRRMCRELSPEQVQAAGTGVYQAFRHDRWFVGAQTIAGYAAVRGEVPLNTMMAASRARWVFPRTDPESRTMTWHVMHTWPTEVGAFGIPEPPPQAPQVAISEVGLWLVPAVATDRSGARLGQGGGYYDTLLAQVRAPVVAVVHHFQHRFELPMEPHDQYVDAVLLPDALHRYRVRQRMLG